MDKETVKDARTYLESKVIEIQQVRENSKQGRRNLIEQTKGERFALQNIT
jgi:hypothetical protein